jgi:hypothetical protein
MLYQKVFETNSIRVNVQPQIVEKCQSAIDGARYRNPFSFICGQMVGLMDVIREHEMYA